MSNDQFQKMVEEIQEYEEFESYSFDEPLDLEPLEYGISAEL